MRTFFYYLFGTIILPKRAFQRMAGDQRQLFRGFRTVLVFGVFSAATAAGLALAGAVPIVPVFIPIPVENYYFWQMIFTLPLLVLAWVITALVVHLLGWGEETGGGFKRTLGITGLALTVPILLVWIPETAAAVLLLIGMTQEELVEILSAPGFWPVFLAVYPPAAVFWTFILLALAAAVSRRIHWIRAGFVALIALPVFWGILIVFLR